MYFRRAAAAWAAVLNLSLAHEPLHAGHGLGTQGDTWLALGHGLACTGDALRVAAEAGAAVATCVGPP